MPEPVTPPAEPVVTPPATTTTTVPLVDDKGNLREGWQEIVDEKYRDDPYLKQVKNLQGLASSTVSARSMVGKDKIVKPNENSSEEDWEAFHIAGGRPPTAAEYNIVRPEGFPKEYWKDDIALAAQDLFHKIGLSPKQVAAIVDFNNQNVLTSAKAQVDAIIAYQQESKDNLYQRWGAAYEPLKHQGNYAIEKGTGGDIEFKNRLLNLPLAGGGRLGDNADFAEYNSNIGGKFAEHGDIVTAHAQTPADIQAEIDKEMHTEAYQKRTHPGHKAALKRVSLLFQEKNKVTPTGR